MKDLDGLNSALASLKETPKFRSIYKTLGTKIEQELKILKEVLVNRQLQIDMLRAKTSVLYEKLEHVRYKQGGDEVHNDNYDSNTKIQINQDISDIMSVVRKYEQD